MRDYEFEQRWRPKGDLRIGEVVSCLKTMQVAFGFKHIYFDPEDRKEECLELSKESIGSLITGQFVQAGSPSYGIAVTLGTEPGDDENCKTFVIQTGTASDSILIDSFRFYIGEVEHFPDISFLKLAIQASNPFEAFILESSNEVELDSYVRQQNVNNFSKPAIIRWLHYLDQTLVDALGGTEFCLKAPAWQVEKFNQGILFQLCEEPFDSDNKEHIKTQKKVMEYLEIM